MYEKMDKSMLTNIQYKIDYCRVYLKARQVNKLLNILIKKAINSKLYLISTIHYLVLAQIYVQQTTNSINSQMTNVADKL